MCNLGAEPVTVPVGGELMLAWDEPTVDADTTALQGHSFAILSTPGQPVDN
ncbi:malto-oligosyltrehalose trehalohydrolase domain protein [Mycobacterium avium subsp. avium 2285 (R)]|nr:malto-oligosyltrehalose trehalohydrolase domain protein [Mycobacterium avium subsp. avium 2285 (R)]